MDQEGCGAKTRRGTPCHNPGSGRGGRCRIHGGASTGPRTQEGLRRSQTARLTHGERSRESERQTAILRELEYLLKSIEVGDAEGWTAAYWRIQALDSEPVYKTVSNATHRP